MHTAKRGGHNQNDLRGSRGKRKTEKVENSAPQRKILSQNRRGELKRVGGGE